MQSYYILLGLACGIARFLAIYIMLTRLQLSFEIRL